MSLRNASSFLAAGVLVAAGLFSGSADAAIVIQSVADDGSALGGPNVFYENFDAAPLGSTTYAGVGGLTLSYTGNGATVTGTTEGVAAAPFLAGSNNQFFGPPATGPDTTRYVAAGSTSAGGSAVFSFAASQNYFGLLIGSLDTFNTLSFFSGATLVGTVTGADLAALGFVAGGLRNSMGTIYVNIVGTAGTTFNRVVATSTVNTFEIDNVAFGVIPEPASIVSALIGGGLFFVRFRRKGAAVVA